MVGCVHMSWFSHDGVDHVVNNYGYVAVALTIGIESMGVPLPGETILVLAAIHVCSGYIRISTSTASRSPL